MKRLAKKLFVLFLGVALVSSTLLVYFTYFTQAKTIPKKSYSKKYLFRIQQSTRTDLIVSSNNRIIYPVNVSDSIIGKGRDIKEVRIFNPKTKRSRVIPNLKEIPSVYGNYGVYIDFDASPDQIILINLTTGNKSSLVSNDNLTSVDISKNYIVYRTYTPTYGYGNASGAIYVYNRKTKTTKKLIDEPSGYVVKIFGKRIAWVSASRGGIYSMDVTKTQPRRIAKIRTGYDYFLQLNSRYVLYEYTDHLTQVKWNLYNLAKRKTTTVGTLKVNPGFLSMNFNLIGNAVYWKEYKKIGESTSPNITDPYRTTIYYYNALQKKKYRLVSSSKYDYELSNINKGSTLIWVRLAKLNNSPTGQGYVYKITIK